MEFHDKYGFLHPTPNPHPLASENGPLFWTIEIVFKHKLGILTEQDARDYMVGLNFLIYKDHGGFKSFVYDLFGWDWSVTPESDRYDFSKDNWRIWDGVTLIRKEFPEVAKRYQDVIDAMCVIHPQLLHPVAFLHALKSKYLLEWKWLDNVLKKAWKVSLKETHKVRKDKKSGQDIYIAKTDGKFMGLVTAIVWGWEKEIEEATMCIQHEYRQMPLPRNNKNVWTGINRWLWENWKNVFLDYFPVEGFPLIELVERLEKKYAPMRIY